MLLWLSLLKFHFCGICVLAMRLENLIHDNEKVALVAYISKRLPVKLILNISALRLPRVQPKNDTFMYI